MIYSAQLNSARRSLLLSALAVSAVPLKTAIARVTQFPELSLNMYNLHTAESVNTVFWADGKYIPDALQELNYFLRDHRTNQTKTIDTRLFSLIYLLNKKIENKDPISVISGYRSAETNRMLATRNPGVAKDSFHVKGRAIDIRIPGKDTKKLRDIGIKLGVGGVGYYERNNFAHFDTGPRRSW